MKRPAPRLHLPRGSRRGVLVAITFVLLTATAAYGGMLEDRLKSTRAEGRDIKQELTVVERRQQVTVKEISRLNTRIAELDGPLTQLEGSVAQLEYRIAQREKRIVKLKEDFRKQRTAIIRLNKELGAARDLLATRVVAAYKNGDTGTLEQLAGAGSLRDLFEREEALGQIVGLDKTVISRITDTERTVRLKRARNHQVRDDIKGDIETLEQEKTQVDAQRADAQARRDEVAAVKAERDSKLKALQSRESQLGKRLDSVEEDAKVLQEVIRTGASTYSVGGGTSPAGLRWPVSGPVVSPFGPRWGRMHEGIDIAISAGNPIYASASGVVTHAGWMGGYGNLVIIQHAGSLSTSYAHQSQIATAVGQAVTQGQLIGFVGCTGHCFGDHVHFETRINGAATDPMAYL
ncbi:MAG: Peptidase [Thermoleophilia bacterium]|jgi:murein DD-endopeptidase MepM/ murein hydrolase activator NlpD|nr:Peptidase [Thermoleophilia bacterium]